MHSLTPHYQLSLFTQCVFHQTQFCRGFAIGLRSENMEDAATLQITLDLCISEKLVPQFHLYISKVMIFCQELLDALAFGGM
jgi:hypothetical protein